MRENGARSTRKRQIETGSTQEASVHPKSIQINKRHKQKDLKSEENDVAAIEGTKSKNKSNNR